MKRIKLIAVDRGVFEYENITERNKWYDEKINQYILVGMKEGKAVYFDKQYILSPLIQIEKVLVKTPLESLNEVIFGQMYIPDFLTDMLKIGEINSSMYDEKDVILAARKQFINENKDDEPWLGMLFLSPDFSSLISDLFLLEELRSIDRKRIEKCYIAMRTFYSYNYNNIMHHNKKREETVIIEYSKTKKYPEVYVLCDNKKSEIHLYDWQQLFDFSIIVKGSVMSIYNEKNILWILIFLCYPLRMRRLKNINIEAEE